MKQRKRYRRGYPNAILVGMEETCSVLWKIFSRVVKPEKTITLFRMIRENREKWRSLL